MCGSRVPLGGPQALARQGCFNHLNIIRMDSVSGRLCLHLFQKREMDAVMVVMMDDLNLEVSHWPQIISLSYIIIITGAGAVNHSQSR